MQFRLSMCCWAVAGVCWTSPACLDAQDTSGSKPGSPPAAAAPSSGEKTGPSTDQYAERLRRLARIHKLSDAELSDELAAASILDAEVGLPLLREQGLCRVALERVKLDVQDLGSLPEVRRVEETIRRKEVQTRLAALLKATPREMLVGLVKLLEDYRLRVEDIKLLGELRTAQKKLAEYEAWDREISVRLKQHVETARKSGSVPLLPDGASPLDQLEQQRERLRKRATVTVTAPEPEAIDAKKLEAVLRTLVSGAGS